MNSSEFAEWWTDYVGKFPSVAKWLGALGVERGEALLRLWAEVLEPVSLADALEVNRRIAHGELEPIGTYDSQRERTAVVVKQYASRIKRAALVQRIASLRAPSTGREETYRCHLCRDTGLARVWHSATVAAVMRDRAAIQDRRNRMAMMVPCSCELGDGRIWEQEGPPPKDMLCWRTRTVQYSRRRYCWLGDDSTLDDEAVQRLLEWCDDRRTDSLAPGEATGPNRFTEFDQIGGPAQ